MKFPIAASLAIASAVLLSSCGGGGGDSDEDSAATIRPKSMDGIVVTLDTNVRFEMVRSVGSAPALLPGEVETGAFYYSLGGNQIRQYPNIRGDNSDCRYPDLITSASYAYRAINDSSGILTLSGVGVNDLTTTGRFNANNGSFAYFFNSDSNFVDNFQIEIDLTFGGNGAFIATGPSTVRISGSTSPLYDTVRIPAAISLVGGAPVPENYNPVVDPERPSRITPASLNDKFFIFANGIPDPNFDFTIQFVTSASFTPGTDANAPDEIGQGLLRVGTSVIDNAVDYTWRRIGGTDTGTLIIAGTNLTFDGTYTLIFTGQDVGTYTGQVDALTANPAEVSGTFTATTR